MDDIKFESINELYNRVLPALKSKKKELYRNGIKYISEKDIWLVISKNKWQKQRDLTLADIVDDICYLKGLNIRLEADADISDLTLYNGDDKEERSALL